MGIRAWSRRRNAFFAAAAAVGLVLAAVLAWLLPGGQRPGPGPAATTRLYSPFTGEPVRSLGPVLAVKIDNLAQARPQTGLASADIVYVVPVEGGLSRMLAVFSSRVPPVTGPVRSARETDLDLLRQFGRPAFAYSGAAPHLLPFIQRARTVDLYAGRVGGYFRDPHRAAPHNLYGRPRQLLAEAKNASDARDIGFRFGAAPPGGRPTAPVTVRYPSASFTFRWSASDGRWLTWMDGRPAKAAEGGQLGAATVIVQHTTVRTSRFLEAGARPPYAVSTGTGTGEVLRDGRSYAVRWSRRDADGGTTFTTADGQRMTFARGPAWVLLTAR